MLFVISFIAIWACIIGGFALHGGHVPILWQPVEVLIIGGAALCAFIIGNPPYLLKAACKSLKYLFSTGPYKKEEYIELLLFINAFSKEIKSKGVLSMEQHIENPHESALINKYPSFAAHHHGLAFFCDYIRLLTMGVDDCMAIEDMMDRELEVSENFSHNIAGGLNTVAESFPALGIVAAVLGVITTMGSISEPPEVLGKLIGAALVGTFLGVLLSYGFFGPMAAYIGKYLHDEHIYVHCLKYAILSNIKGYAPVITVENARSIIPEHLRPSFAKIDEIIMNES